MDSPNSIVFEIVIAVVAGLYALRQGWMMIRNPVEASPNPIWQIAIALVRMVQGEESAVQKKNELMMPERVRQSGILFLIVGGGLLLAGCLQFVGLVIKMVGV